MSEFEKFVESRYRDVWNRGSPLRVEYYRFGERFILLTKTSRGRAEIMRVYLSWVKSYRIANMPIYYPQIVIDFQNFEYAKERIPHINDDCWSIVISYII